jgi:hypothetical protein
MRFGISMDGGPMIHVGNAGNLQSGMIELAAKILKRDLHAAFTIGGVWKFEPEQAHKFFDKAKNMSMGNKDSAMFWSSMIHASTHNTWCRISFFDPRYEIGYLQDALEQSQRDAANANDTERHLKEAAFIAQKEREAAQRHIDRLRTALEAKRNEPL